MDGMTKNDREHCHLDITTTETRTRGGRVQHRATCTCGWSSTWQGGPETMATNAAAAHRAKASAVAS
jgi:hypothetical protein